MVKHFWLFCSFFLASAVFYGQDHTIKLRGTVHNEDGSPLLAFLSVDDGQKMTETNPDGEYQIALQPGRHQLTISALGYLDHHQDIDFQSDTIIRKVFVLETDPEMNLDEVTLFGKSRLSQIRESSFTVEALDAEALHNSTQDVSEALENVSGMHVRHTGGMGSDYDVMLNGFSGNHVKYFVDGVPMEGFNSAFQLNNIPINLAKRVEVYKGVVPLGLGSDALGGAVNIVTDQSTSNFLEASYSFGSFNTHKGFLNGGYTTDSGFRTEFTAFLNYSDNNYRVDADIADLENNQFTGDIRRVERFHDRYRNYSLMGKVGFVDKPFADRLMFGLTYGDVYDQIQNPAYMKIAFGDKYTTSQTLMPSLTYKKEDLLTNDFNVSLNATYNFGKSKNIDDSYRRYNWLGDYVVTDAPGEFTYSKRHQKDRNASINATLDYTIKDQHTFTVDNVLNAFSRKSKDEVTATSADDYPQETRKDILGLSYKYHPNDRLNVSLFSKNYFNHVSQYADPNSSGNYEQMHRSTHNWGYGVAASYFLTKNLQLKSSFEKSYRLPTGRELFGVGNSFELGNPDLEPESSDNLNVGLHYNWELTQNHLLKLDGSFIYRNIKDFIRQIPSPEDGVLKPGNEASVKNRGIDFGVTYEYDDLFSLEGNLTYQDMRNKLKYKSGKDVVSTTYNDRVPNIPYLYGNANANLFLDNVWKEKDHLQLHYNLLYIHDFDYSHESYGGREIPTQLSHDIGLSYSFDDGRYNIAADLYNIFNKTLYDNFSLQKPGRHFSVKLRYYLDQF